MCVVAENNLNDVLYCTVLYGGKIKTIDVDVKVKNQQNKITTLPRTHEKTPSLKKN